MHIRIYPRWVGGDVGYLYDVTYRGEVIVRRSRVPELDAARVLQGRGITGRLRVLDGTTGAPRSTIAIRKGSLLTVREDRQRSPLFVKWEPHPRNLPR